MKNKALMILLAACVLTGSVAAPAAGLEVIAAESIEQDEEEEGGEFSYSILEDGTAVITGYSGNESMVLIPAEVDGKRVTGIGDYAFEKCENITGVVIPEGISSIEGYTFGECTSLTSVSIPKSVTYIDEYAFSGCKNLDQLEVSKDNTKYTSENGVLYNKEKTEIIMCPKGETQSVIIPETVTEIARSAFDDCEELQNISVQANNVRYASEDGILYSHERKELIRCPAGKQGDVVVAEGVTSIGYRAFGDCVKVTKVTLPESLVGISMCAFDRCYRLADMYIPKNVSEVGINAFLSCNSLGSIEVDENNMTYASRDGMLSSKDGTTLVCCPPGKSGEVTIAAGVTTIGEGAFDGCVGLTNIVIPNGVKEIGQFAFYGCNGLTNVAVPDGVENIGNCAFGSCEGLIKVWLPQSIKSIGNDLFWGCTKLANIEVDQNNMYYASDAGILYNKQKTILMRCPEGKQGNIVIPEGVQVIGESAFNDCINLLNISVPDSVIAIEKDAFLYLDNLDTVYYAGTEEQWEYIKGSEELSGKTVCFETATIPGAFIPSVVDKTNIPVAAIQLDKTDVRFDSIGATVTLTAIVRPDNATDKTVIWESSNLAVAVVSNGNVRAVGNGTAFITAKVGDKIATATVTVDQREAQRVEIKNAEVKVSKLTVKGRKTMKAKKSQKLKLTVLPENASNKKVKWKSSNKKIATVNAKGKVKAKAKGTVKITATAKDGSKTKAVFTIKVK